MARSYNTSRTSSGPAFSQRDFLVWLLLLCGLTGLSVLLLRHAGINPDHDFSPFILIIAYASSLAALITTAVFHGRAGLGKLLRPILKWRVNFGWYAGALLGPMLLIVLANLVFMLAGGRPAWSDFFDIGAVAAGFGAIIAGCLGEEIGWRGFAQPLLQKRTSLLVAAVIVGIIWASWHLWPILAPGGSNHLVAADITQTYLRLISTAVIYAWIYQRTASLLLVMLAHAGHNVAVDLLPVQSDTLALLIAAGYAVIACLIAYSYQTDERRRSGTTKT